MPQNLFVSSPRPTHHLVFFLAFWCLWAPHSHSSEGQNHETRQLTILLTSGMSGQLMRGDRTVAAVPALLKNLAATARAEDRGVVVIDAGRTLAPYAESRHDRGRTMGQILAAGGCQVFAPAPFDFSLGADTLRDLTRDMPFPVLLPFVSEDSRLQNLVTKARLEPLDGMLLEVVSLFDQQLVDDLEAINIQQAKRRTLKTAPEDALRIAIVHSWDLEKTLTDHRFTWELVEEEGIYDVLIDPDIGHDLTLERRGSEGSLFLVGRDFDHDNTWSVLEIQLEVEFDGERYRPRSLKTIHHALDDWIEEEPTVAELSRRAFEHFRESTKARLPLPESTQRSDLEEYVLKAVREVARAEVAIFNRGAFRPVDPSFYEQPPTEELIHRFLSVDLHLAVGYLTGSQLKQLFELSKKRRDEDGKLRRTALLWLGMESVDGSFGSLDYEVNSRELRPQDRYRVVTNTYLTSGGDSYPTLAAMKYELLQTMDGTALEVRDDVVLPRLRTRGTKDFPNLSRGLWRFGFERLKLSFSGVETSADPAYQEVSDSRASAESSGSVSTDLYFRLDQEWPGFRWENRLRARFGLLDTENRDRTESADDLRFEIGGEFTRTPFLGAHPYASFILDTEFRRNTTPRTRPGLANQRLPRQREESLTLGLRWSTERLPIIRLSMVARHQDDVETADRFGLQAELEYLIESQTKRPGFEATLEAEMLEGQGATVTRLDLELKTPVRLTSTLKLTPAYNVYVYKDSRLPGQAEYQRLSLGLTYRWIGKHQRWGGR